jgi:hypothetical protein
MLHSKMHSLNQAHHYPKYFCEADLSLDLEHDKKLAMNTRPSPQDQDIAVPNLTMVLVAAMHSTKRRVHTGQNYSS